MNFAQSWPDSILPELLSDFRGARAEVFPLRNNLGKELGNHGDALMLEAFRKRFGRLGLQQVTSNPDVLVVPPNGALLEDYGAPRLLQRWLASRKPVPVIVFPSSANFPSVDPAAIFGRRPRRTIWVLREASSYEHLSSRWGGSLASAGVELALDHDMVVSGRDDVLAMLGGGLSDADRDEGPLLVARLGAESRDMRGLASPTTQPTWAKARLVTAFQKFPDGPLKRRLRRGPSAPAQAAANEAMLNVLSGVVDMGTPRSAAWYDIPDPTMSDFEQFRTHLRRTRLVATNRLHVALPSAILGHEVFLVDAGYHKLAGVYERSLTALPNVHFLARPA